MESTVDPSSPDFPAFPSSKVELPPRPINSYAELLEYFQADVIALQEVKMSRSSREQLAKAAFVAGYDSFFSFSRKRQGYSGVTTYTRTRTACPVAAEEGVTGTLAPIASTIPTASLLSPSLHAAIGHNSALLSAHSANDLRDLDGEGRCVITDHGAFLLFNLYVPNSGESRNDFKLRFLQLLELRLRECVTAGRAVVVVGDINIAASPLDHCRPELVTLDDGSKVPFEDSPSRVWWRKNVAGLSSPAHADSPASSTLLVDSLRVLHPTQRNAYTCWNTLTGARAGNYGARIDYVLLSHSLTSALRDARVLAHVEGSDHCPVQCDLDGAALEGWRCGEVAPAHASQWWVEFSGQQKKLSQFFVKKPVDEAEVDATGGRTADSVSEAAGSVVVVGEKRRVEPATSTRAAAKKRKGGEKGQSGPSLLSYFGTAASSRSSPSAASVSLVESPPPPQRAPAVAIPDSLPPTPPRAATEARPSPSSPPSASAATPSSSARSPPPSLSPSSKQSATPSSDFARLFTQKSVMLACHHQQPARLWTVNKKGKNHGRQFLCCALPPPDRCSFWIWYSDALKARKRRKEGGAGGGGRAGAESQRELQADDEGQQWDGGEGEAVESDGDSHPATTSQGERPKDVRAGFVTARFHPSVRDGNVVVS